eukprot:jgi/Psemu1/46643/gm1.46643_g
MTETAVSWNEVRGIHFSFGPNFTAGNRQGDLNAVFSRILPNISSLFIVDDEGVETLRTDPIPVLKSLIKYLKHTNAISPPKTTIFWHSKAIGGRIRVRDKQALDIAAKHANRGRPIIQLVLNIIHWKFHSKWYPYEFHKVYDAADGIPSDKTGSFVKPPSRSRLHHTKPTAPVVSETLPVPSHPTIVPSGTTALVHTKPTVSNPIKTPSNSTEPNDSCYTWTWTYSSNSDSVSFHRDKSTRTLVQRQNESSPVTTPSVSPSARTRFGHHSAPPCEPANFRWTFNPQSETVVFHRLPKPASVPLTPSLQLSSPTPKAIHDGILTFAEHSTYSSHLRCEIYLSSNQTVFYITKRHRDALKIKMLLPSSPYIDAAVDHLPYHLPPACSSVIPSPDISSKNCRPLVIPLSPDECFLSTHGTLIDYKLLWPHIGSTLCAGMLLQFGLLTSVTTPDRSFAISFGLPRTTLRHIHLPSPIILRSAIQSIPDQPMSMILDSIFILQTDHHVPMTLFGLVVSIPVEAIDSRSGGVYHNDKLRILFPSFDRNWKIDDPANYFNSIYTDDNKIPSDTNADAIVTTPHSSGPSVPPNTATLTSPFGDPNNSNSNSDPPLAGDAGNST